MLFPIELFLLIPIAGFVISIFIPAVKEKLLSGVAFVTVGIHLLCYFSFVVYWLFNGHQVLNVKDIVLYKSEGYEFFIDFCFDEITAVYLFVGTILTFLIAVYSRSYLHRESGFKRYFNTMLFFYIGYNVVVLAGNMETLFIGWEILGICSFLLIAFYRNRYLPVKNAVKVFSIYRIGDVGLILAMWMSHHLWHANTTFLELRNYEMVHDHLQNHGPIGIFISLMFLLTAAAKSAQLPFSSWLPKAMEGPTPSSAIFYGSLSVHLGVFLMMRTFPFWEHQLSVRIIIGLMGFVTSLICGSIARVQSSVKAQIAYSSISQIGIMFIEIAAGFETLALVHFAANAFLRTYQLLVSPSVVTYLIREQFYNFVPRKLTFEDSLPKKLEYSLYVLSLKEWNLDSIMYQYLWNPVKFVGGKFNFLNLNRVIMIFIPIYLLGIALLFNKNWVPLYVTSALPTVFALIGLAMVIKAFSERKQALMSWTMVIMNHFWVALAIAFNDNVTFDQILYYIIGVIIAGGLGYVCLYRLRQSEGSIGLDKFHGHSLKHPKIAFLFLIACLGLAGFPITPTFIGEDLIFSHIHEYQLLLAFFVSLSFIIDGLAIFRIYARVFLGPHVKSEYDMAYRSS